MIAVPDKVWFGMVDILTSDEETELINSVAMKHKCYIEFDENLLTDKLRGKLEMYLLKYKR